MSWPPALCSTLGSHVGTMTGSRPANGEGWDWPAPSTPSSLEQRGSERYFGEVFCSEQYVYRMSMSGPGIVPKVPTVVRVEPSDEREGEGRAADENLRVASTVQHADTSAPSEGNEPYPTQVSGAENLELSGLRA